MQYSDATVLLNSTSMTNSVINRSVYYSLHVEAMLLDTTNSNLYKITSFVNFIF